MATIDQRTALGVLTKPRVLEVAAALGLGLAGRLLKSELVDAIAASLRAPFPRILEQMRRDELKAICRTAGIDDSGRAKAVVVDRILGRRPDGTTDTLTKADLIEAVATTTGILNKDAEVIVNAALAVVLVKDQVEPQSRTGQEAVAPVARQRTFAGSNQWVEAAVPAQPHALEEAIQRCEPLRSSPVASHVGRTLRSPAVAH